jgi:glycerol kinase
LTDGKSFCTEHTNASRTMLYDLHKGEFTAELLAIFGIPKAILPEIRASNAHFGVTTNFLPLPDGVPITGCLGDQQAALFGHGFTETGGAKVTMGTGAFLLFNVGNTLQRSTSSKEMQGLLTTVALAPKGGDRSFAVEASAFIAGAAVQFLRDNFGWFEKSIECEALIAASKRDPNLLFIPALAGLGSPYWNADAKGVLFGLTRGSTRGEIVRAVVESIAFQNVYLLDLMQRCGGAALRDLAVDGKVALNDPLMQLQSDILGIPVLRPADVDITARGAARIALAGLTNDIGTATNITQTGTARKFIPAPDHARTKTLYDEWCRAQHVVDQFYRGKFW